MKKYKCPAGMLSERTLRSMLNELMKTLRRTKGTTTRMKLQSQAESLRVQIQEAARRRLQTQLASLDSQEPPQQS